MVSPFRGASQFTASAEVGIVVTARLTSHESVAANIDVDGDDTHGARVGEILLVLVDFDWFRDG